MSNMPIAIIIIALLINIASGVRNNIDFSYLMIRCIVVTIVFGIFGYMVTKTIQNALEYSSIRKNISQNAKEESQVEINPNKNENVANLDIKLPPLGYEELLNMDNNSDDEFVEINPVYMKNHNE